MSVGVALPLLCAWPQPWGSLVVCISFTNGLAVCTLISASSGPETDKLTERFYGFTENSREVDMDMREMVNKVKNGEPLYGPSKLSSYIQGVAARNSRYSELFIHVLPWINVVNHEQVSQRLRSSLCTDSH